MFRQDSDKAPVTFDDVAESFSEVEWKLLHQWQKELYNNVMKEIHQALISLGPLIASSVFSLRNNEHEDECLMDHQDSERRTSIQDSLCDTISSSDVLLKKRRLETQYLNDPQDTERRENTDYCSTGIPFLNSDVSRKKQEFESSLMDPHATDIGESSTGPISGHVVIPPEVPLSIKEDDTHSIGHQDSERSKHVINATGFPVLKTESEANFIDRRCAGGEMITSLSSGHALIPPEVPFSVKEGEVFSIDSQGSKRREHANGATDFPFLKTESKAAFIDHHCSRGESGTSLSSVTGNLVIPPEVSLSSKEGETFPIGHQDSQRREHLNNSTALPYTTGFPFLKTESEADFMDHHCAGGESSTSLNSGHAVIALRATFSRKKKGETCSTDHRDTERRANVYRPTGHVVIPPEDTLNIQETETFSIDHQDSERKEHVSSAKEFPFLKTEPETTFMDHHCAGGESSPSLSLGHAFITPVASFSRKEEEETYSMDHRDSDRRASAHHPDEHIIQTPTISFGIKEDGQTYHMDHQDSEKGECVNSHTSNGTLKRKRKDRDPVKSTEVTPCKAPSGKAKLNVLQSSERGTHCTRQLWSERHHGQGGDKTAQVGFGNETHSNLHQATPTLVTTELYNEWESNVRKAAFVACPPNPLQIGRQYPSTELEQTVSHKGSPIEHPRSHGDSNPERNRPYQCTENEKDVGQMKHVFEDQTAQFSDKPYTCVQCDKSFSQMASLNRHQRTHSKERPYQCSECEKSFNRKDNLIRHQRSHTGDFQAHLDMLPTIVTPYELQNESVFGPMQVLRRTFSVNLRE